MQKQTVTKSQLPRRGIYLLPNLFTTAGLFAGFYAIVSAMNGEFELAAIAIFIAMIMDIIDGRVARLTHTETAFGVQYDSLSDMASFGIAPALVAYTWGVSELGKLGWLLTFVFAAATALRLARFNSRIGQGEKRYFQGLPCPAAAGMVAGMVWLGHDYAFSAIDFPLVAAIIVGLLGVLMVSSIPYYSFKEINLRGKVPFVTLIIVVLIFVGIALSPPRVLFVLFLGYALSGPLMIAWRWIGRLRKGRSLLGKRRRKR